MKNKASATVNNTTASLGFAVAIFILSTLLLGWAIFPHLPQQVAQYIHGLNVQRRMREIQRLLAKDPKPGQVMDMPAIDLLGRRLPSTEKLSVAFVGTVRGHNRERIIQWLKRESGNTTTKWVVIAIGEKDVLQALQSACGDKIQVVQDVKGSWHTRWNAVVIPRVYAVDNERRLLLIRRTERGCAECTGCGGE